MNCPQIQMQSKMGQIEISQTRRKQEITQPKAELSIKQPSAEIEIRTTPSRLIIDQTKAWEDMNLMSVLRSSEKFAEEGKTGLQEGIARRAEQGRQMMEIEHQGQVFVNQAISNSERSSKNLNIAFMVLTHKGHSTILNTTYIFLVLNIPQYIVLLERRFFKSYLFGN